MQDQFRTGSVTVDRMSRLHISGNIIPVTWYKTIRKSTGKPNLNAIIILADIVYWYRPTEVRDEMTGELVGLKKKFHADLLQRSYQQIADQFGITKRDATNAVVELEKMKVIRRDDTAKGRQIACFSDTSCKWAASAKCIVFRFERGHIGSPYLS